MGETCSATGRLGMKDSEHVVNWREVGAVEILADRIYPLDPLGSDLGPSTEVVVPPGTYPVYRNGDSYCWLMRGQINARSEVLGQGLMVVGGIDMANGLEVQFPSRTYRGQEFDELRAAPESQPGPQQRLRFTMATAEPTVPK